MTRYSSSRTFLFIVLEGALFAALSWYVRLLDGSPIDPVIQGASEGPRLLLAAWWIVGGRLAVHCGHLLLRRQSRGQEVRLVSDLVAAVIYLATLFAVIRFAFGLPIGGLLATSGIIAIVLGLALQSTMGDVFSGIAVGLERPYKPGDIITVDGGVEGTVVEINWRSTLIATGNNNIVIIPNSVIAKSRLENRSAPTTVRGDNVVVSLDPHIDPRRCLTALGAAVRACRILLTEPAPSVICNGLQGDGARYEIWYSVASSRDISAARTELFTQIHRHLRHAGIPLAVPGLAHTIPVKVPSIGDLLEQSDIFGVLDADERAVLAEHFTKVAFEAGDVLVKEGDAPSTLYMLVSGTVELGRQDRTLTLTRLGPGEAFGLIALITDRPYSVSATALTSLTAYRMGKEDIAAAMKARPELMVGLEALAKRGLEILERELASHEQTPLKSPEMFLSRLRQFLSKIGG
jgi:small-conductance mechanosensitive channel/CRP-like cAMP-binding protein